MSAGGEPSWAQVSDDDDDDEPSQEPVDQDAEEASSRHPRDHGTRTTWASLDSDVKEEIRRKVFDFNAMYEASAAPNADRVGVPDPAVIRKDHWRLDATALALCRATKANDLWCKRLVEVACERERLYWQSHAPPMNFDLVKQAIEKRDGVVIDEEAGEVRLVSSLGSREPGERVPRSRAIELIVRARYWYPLHFTTANRQPFLTAPTLRLAGHIVAMAQLMLKWQDDHATHGPRFKLSEWMKFHDISHALGLEDSHDPPFRDAAVYFTSRVPLDPSTLLPFPGATETVYDPLFPDHIKPSRYIELARRIIAVYGPPDLWNTSQLDSFEDAFTGKRVEWGTRPEAMDARAYIASVLPNLLHDKTDTDPDESFVSPDWPMGLYDTSRVREMTTAFENNNQFQHYIGGWDMRNVETLHAMFHSAVFNGPIDAWRMPKLSAAHEMFFFNEHFNQPLDEWARHMQDDTEALVGTLTVRIPLGFDADNMFFQATAFAQPLPQLVAKLLDRGEIPDVTVTTMDMFKGAKRFLARVRKNRCKYLGADAYYLKTALFANSFVRILKRGTREKDYVQDDFSDAEPEDDGDDGDDGDDVMDAEGHCNAAAGAAGADDDTDDDTDDDMDVEGN